MPWRTSSTNIRLTGTVTIGDELPPALERRRVGPRTVEGHWLGLVLLAVVAFVPTVASRPGRLVLDTYDRLYVDPSGTLTTAADRWNPISALGSFVDKTYDHGFPMSQWFWGMDHLGVPVWLAHRLWLGAIIFLAGAGVAFLLRTMVWVGRGWMLAALTYQCSPYVLSYAGTTSTVLLAWAALPWLVACMMRSLTAPEWRAPAACALILGLVGSGNVTATIYLAVAGAAWFLYATVASRDVEWREALGAFARVVCLVSIVSIWWVTSLIAHPQAAFDDLRVNDPVEAVRSASPVSEVVRGLGDWRLYTDQAVAGIASGDELQRSPWLIAVGFALPAIALAALVRVRFRSRVYFVVLFAIGAILAAGTHAIDEAEPFAAMMRTIVDEGAGALTNPGHRAVPLLWLAVAVGVAAAVRRIHELRPGLGGVFRFSVAGLVFVSALPFVRGGALDGSRAVLNGVPAYWRDAADAVNAIDSSNNVLELPTMTSVQYSWGSTNDPISYALFDRPVGLAEPGARAGDTTAALLRELDDRIQRGELTATELRTVAHLLSADTIVVRADGVDDTERAGRVRELLADETVFPAPATFGETIDGDPAVSVSRLPDVPARIRTVSAERLVALTGSPQGVLDLVQAGVVDGASLVVATEDLTLVDLTGGRVDELAPFALTDSHRPEVTDRYLQRAPDAPPIDRPTIEWDGATAISVHSPDGPDPVDVAHRAAKAFDGDVRTSWLTGAGGDPIGDTLNVVLDGETTASSITLAQPRPTTPSRRITKVRLLFDGRAGEDVELNAASVTRDGQTIELGDRSFTALAIKIMEVEPGDPELRSGFSLIDFGESTPTEVVRLPDEFTRFGREVESHPIVVTLSRWIGPETGEPAETGFHRRLQLDRSGRGATLRAVVSGDPGPGCRDGLLMINGNPVGLRAATPEDAALDTVESPSLPEGFVEMRVCEGDAYEGLLAGENDVRTAPTAGAQPVIIERLVFRRTLGQADSVAEVTPIEAPVVTTRGPTYATITVPDASQPLWVVYGASIDEGWSGDLDGRELDPPRRANGYAFSWPIISDDADSHTVEVRWSPQRAINVTVMVSSAGLLLALVLVIRPRRRRTKPAAPAAAPPTPDPRRYVHPLVVVIVSLGVFGLTAGPIPGIAAGLTALVLEQRPHLFNRLAWLPTVLLAGAGIGRAVWQVVEDPPPGPGWPSGAPLVDEVVWIAIAMATAMALANTDRPAVHAPLPPAVRSRR
jgi:Alpha-(1->3)-arabinofuranosyltransferase